MTDSLKLAEMQRTSIEFERQRHLANWFIKSSPHMATPPSPSFNPNGGENSISSNNCNNSSRAQKPPTAAAVMAANNSTTTTTNNNLGGTTGTGTTTTTTSSSSGNGTKNGTITTSNPLFYLMNHNGPHTTHPHPSHQGKHPVGTVAVTSSGGGGVGGNLLMSRSQIFTSQTNLPLQIVTATSGQDGRKPKLRRFNSHDTSANMFSVADFENARLARRNEIEMKQRLQQRMKMNSLSSGGGDCSTGDSKGSKYSNESQTDPLQADLFLDRYSLPRVVRISYKTKFCNETLQSSSSNGSTSTQSSTASSSNNNNNNIVNSNKNNCNDASRQNGELFLLYRHLKQRKIYHGFNTKNGVANRKKGVMIPQEFTGYFSLVNDKGAPTATMYTTLVQLVRERVYKFISVGNLTAFTESSTGGGDTFPSRPHYIKSNARSGQVFRLLAVFEDGKQEATSSSSASAGKSSALNSGREKDKGRYAQLLNENRQILYVSLSTKGKFYEIEPAIPQILQKTAGPKDAPPKKLNPDCVHRISALVAASAAAGRPPPLALRFISGPPGCTNAIPENVTITRISTEDIVISCPIEDVEAQSPLHLRKLTVTADMTCLKCFLGFESEQRMLANPNVQNILKFCQFNCDQFLKMVEIEILHRAAAERSASRSRVDSLKMLKPLSLLRREKSSSVIAHEKEDSIIFLSKSDLASMEEPATTAAPTRISDKMKVFQSTKKKWFRRGDKHTSLTSLDIDVHSKRMSMERYSDMSKLLQERFGVSVEATIAELGETSSTVSTVAPPARQPTHASSQHIQKSMSLQEVDFVGKPDLVRHAALGESVTTIQSAATCDGDGGDGGDGDDKENIMASQQQQQSSFITTKLFSEFHVKTRQYSKSSSSLHQLLHFAVPPKMNVVEMTSAAKKQQNKVAVAAGRKLDFNIGGEMVAPPNGGDLGALLTTAGPNGAIIDDLPYSSVRDSLLISNNDINDLNGGGDADADQEQASMLFTLDPTEYAKENIYAEICGGEQPGATMASGPSAISRIQINGNGEFEVEDRVVHGGHDRMCHVTNGGGASNDNIYNTLK